MAALAFMLTFTGTSILPVPTRMSILNATVVSLEIATVRPAVPVQWTGPGHTHLRRQM